jgi:hypothetical protein
MKLKGKSKKNWKRPKVIIINISLSTSGGFNPGEDGEDPFSS